MEAARDGVGDFGPVQWWGFGGFDFDLLLVLGLHFHLILLLHQIISCKKYTYTMNTNMNKKIYTNERILYGNWENRIYEQQVHDRHEDSKIGNNSTVQHGVALSFQEE